MERKIYLIVLFCYFSTSVAYSSNSGGRLVYRAYTENDMALWKRTIERLHSMPVMSSDQMLELVNYLYGYTGWAVGERNTREVRRYLQITEAYLDTLEARRYKPADVLAYRSAMLGYRIGLSPLSAPVLGPRSVRYARQSVALNPASYLAHMQLGHIYFYAPESLGGDKKEAVGLYLKSLKLYNQQGGIGAGDWNYLNLLITIGQAYEKTGRLESARRYYQRALDAEPGLAWVRNELLPELEKQLSN